METERDGAEKFSRRRLWPSRTPPNDGDRTGNLGQQQGHPKSGTLPMVLLQGAPGKLKGVLERGKCSGTREGNFGFRGTPARDPIGHSPSNTPDWVELSRFEDDAVDEPSGDEDDFDAINRGGNQASKPIVRPPVLSRMS
jgi:hypothetical protein